MQNETFFFPYLFYAFWTVIVVLFLVGIIIIKSAIKNTAQKKQKGPTPRERAIEFIEKICEELRNLGETITCKQEYSRWEAYTANGLRRIDLETFAEFGYVSIRTSPLSTGYVGGSEGFIRLDHDIEKYFLNGRKASEIIYPEQFDQKDPKEIAKRFLDLAIEFGEIFVFLTGIEARAKEAKAAIDKEAATKKAEVDRQTQKQIVMLLKPKI